MSCVNQQVLLWSGWDMYRELWSQASTKLFNQHCFYIEWTQKLSKWLIFWAQNLTETNKTLKKCINAPGTDKLGHFLGPEIFMICKNNFMMTVVIKSIFLMTKSGHDILVSLFLCTMLCIWKKKSTVITASLLSRIRK